MRSLALFLLCLFAFGSCQDLTGWSLIWYDEFDGTELNTTKWQNEVDCWGGGNGELQCYTARQENCKVASGNLILTAVPGAYTGTTDGCTNNNDNSCTFTKNFTSARIRSLYDPSGSFVRGRFEIRAILPNGKHLWPAFWMLATDNVYGSWAASGEFDILEARGEETSMFSSTLHYGGVWPNDVYTTSGKLDMGSDLSAAYHIYAMEWEETEVRFYWDSNMVYSLALNKSWCPSGATNCPYSQIGQPWDQKFHILLNLAIGGNFFNGYPDLTAADVQAWSNPSFIVDYVRVYARSNNAGSTSTSGSDSTTGSGSTTTGNGGSTTTGGSTITRGSTTTGAADNNVLANQNQGNTVNGMTEDQVRLYFYIAVGCSIGSVVILIVALSIFAVWWRKKKSETLAPIGFH